MTNDRDPDPLSQHQASLHDEVDGDETGGHSALTCEPDGVCHLTIVNRRGLHARASAKLVKLVERYDAQVEVSRDGQTVGGTSIMGLMMLAAGPGSLIRVAAAGNDAAAVLEAIADLVGQGFGETD